VDVGGEGGEEGGRRRGVCSVSGWAQWDLFDVCERGCGDDGEEEVEVEEEERKKRFLRKTSDISRSLFRSNSEVQGVKDARSQRSELAPALTEL
jgi:hypothetical protein